MSERQQVAVVTGGGGGIGAAIAEELGRGGWFVVTVDPLVTLDGTASLPPTEETTAERINAIGGSARASAVSVTDGDAVAELFSDLVGEHGGVDAVVNVAGITRQTGFAHGTEEDWKAVLSVHLGGYLNVLAAALPVMAATGRGHILGVTSGSGWRPANAGAYSCAKRAVAALTWQLGRHTPPGVTVNAVSPIAATRMVAAAIERAKELRAAGGGGESGGGLSLFSMPGPEDLGPLGAYLVSDRFAWCNGRVLFAGGSEVALVDEPRLLEVVRTGPDDPVGSVLDTVVPRAFVGAERAQATEGGGNPRFGPLFEAADAPPPAPASVGTCAIVSDRPVLAAALTTVLEARGVSCHRLKVTRGFADAEGALRSIAANNRVDAVVVAAAGSSGDGVGGWLGVVGDHARIVDQIHADAGWARAVSDYAGSTAGNVALVTVTDASGPGGRSRAQAAAQLARAAAGSTEGRVAAFAVGIEASEKATSGAAAELVGHVLSHPDAGALAGAELVVGNGWTGLRSHPRPAGAVTYGGPALPEWLDGALREMAGATDEEER